MITAIQVVLLLLVAAGGWAVVTSREPSRQAIMVSLYGLILAILFFAFQAPDVALSQLVVGAVALPIIILAAIAKTRTHTG